MVIELPGGNRIELDHGRMVRSVAGPLDGQQSFEGVLKPPRRFGDLTQYDTQLATMCDDLVPLGADLADELGCIAAYLDAQSHHVEIIHCDGTLSVPSRPLPSFSPTRSTPL